MKLTQRDRVVRVTAGGRWLGQWLTLPEIQAEIKAQFGVLDSETGISARLRELRKLGLAVECRRRAGRKIREYRVGAQPARSAADTPVLAPYAERLARLPECARKHVLREAWAAWTRSGLGALKSTLESALADFENELDDQEACDNGAAGGAHPSTLGHKAPPPRQLTLGGPSFYLEYK